MIHAYMGMPTRRGEGKSVGARPPPPNCCFAVCGAFLLVVLHENFCGRPWLSSIYNY